MTDAGDQLDHPPPVPTSTDPDQVPMFGESVTADIGGGLSITVPRASLPRARNTDPATSHAAAASISEDSLRASQAAVLDMFKRHGPMTDVAAAIMYRLQAIAHDWPAQSQSGLRTRRKELTDAKLLKDSGETRVLNSGRKSIVWEAT